MSVRVLIADPDESLLDSYREYLQQQDFAVVTASNAVECVDRLRDSSPDVLVLEPALPWGGGDGVLAMMREEPDISLVPVILLSLGRDRQMLYRLAPFQIDDYQVKPLSARRLAERIRAIMGVRRTEPAAPRTPVEIGDPSTGSHTTCRKELEDGPCRTRLHSIPG